MEEVTVPEIASIGTQLPERSPKSHPLKLLGPKKKWIQLVKPRKEQKKKRKSKTETSPKFKTIILQTPREFCIDDRLPYRLTRNEVQRPPTLRRNQVIEEWGKIINLATEEEVAIEIKKKEDREKMQKTKRKLTRKEQIIQLFGEDDEEIEEDEKDKKIEELKPEQNEKQINVRRRLFNEEREETDQKEKERINNEIIEWCKETAIAQEAAEITAYERANQKRRKDKETKRYKLLNSKTEKKEKEKTEIMKTEEIKKKIGHEIWSESEMLQLLYAKDEKEENDKQLMPKPTKTIKRSKKRVMQNNNKDFEMHDINDENVKSWMPGEVQEKKRKLEREIEVLQDATNSTSPHMPTLI